MPTYDYICDALWPRVRGFESIKADPRKDCPECSRAQAAPQDRAGRRDPVQGVGLLPDRLPERVVQEGRQGGQAGRRRREAARASRRLRRRRHPSGGGSEPSKPDAQPIELTRHDPGTLSDLFASPIEIAALDDLPSFPFCSERCRLIDLGRWVDGRYAIPGRRAQPPESGGEARTRIRGRRVTAEPAESTRRATGRSQSRSAHPLARRSEQLGDGQAVGAGGLGRGQVGAGDVAGLGRERLVELAGRLALAVDLVVAEVAEDVRDGDAPGRRLAVLAAAVAVEVRGRLPVLFQEPLVPRARASVRGGGRCSRGAGRGWSSR